MLAECEAAGVGRFLLGGDYCAFGPWPLETLERLDELEAVAWIRGNGERWLVEDAEVPEEGREFVETSLAAARAELSDDQIRRLYGLPTQVEIDGVCYCHGSPLSDVESFAPEPREGEERLLAGTDARTIVFGHSHIQFTRRGPRGTELVNPGSAGMPIDGDRRAAWALRADDGDFELRRVEYDVDRAVAKLRSLGDWTAPVVHRLEHGADA